MAMHFRAPKSPCKQLKRSVQNLNLLQAGRGEVAFALANSVGFAWKGEAGVGFDSKLDKLRTIASIYPNYIQVVATKASGAQTLADLKGKRVSVGAPRSGTEITRAGYSRRPVSPTT